jgi:hypothetical protein
MNRDEMHWKTAPPVPKPNTTIWRYMSRRVFLTLASERLMEFHQFKDLQKIDAREGMVVPGFWESMVKYYGHRYKYEDFNELRARAERSLDRMRCFTYANCWNATRNENILMWKAYAPRGIAIRSTVGKFKNALQGQGNDRLSIRLQKIVYADHWHELEKRGYRHNSVVLNNWVGYSRTYTLPFPSGKTLRGSFKPEAKVER